MAGRQARDGGPAEAALFITEMAGELAMLAHHHHLDTLRYLLDMARLEAEEQGKVQAEADARKALVLHKLLGTN